MQSKKSSGWSAQAKGARLVSVACARGCTLERLCDMAVHLPLVRSFSDMPSLREQVL